MDVTNREAMKRAGVSERSLRRWRSLGLKSTVGEDGLLRMRLEDVMAFKRRQAFNNPRRPRSTS